MAEIDANNGSISFGGLSSNLDTKKIIGAMVEAQRQPMAKIEQQQAVIDAHSELLEGIASKVRRLGDQSRAMESLSRMLPQQAISSDPSVVRASAGEGARAGTHRIEVCQLARAERTVSRAFAAPDIAGQLGEGRLSWRAEGKEYFVDIDGQSSLQTLASALNSQAAGIVAAVLYDGTAHRLSIRALNTGAAAALSMTDTSQLGLGSSASHVLAAGDARFILDDHLTMTRPTNIISDAIEGITLRLESEGPAQTISVASETLTLSAEIEEAVERYNEVRSEVDAASRPGRDYERSRLVGDSSLRNLIEALRKAVTASVHGLPSGKSSLASVGITSSREGKLVIDVKKLSESISDSPLDVARLFARDGHLGSKGVATSLSKVCDQYISPITGTLTLRLKAMGKERARADERLAQMQNNLDRYEQTTRRKFTDLERDMTVMKAQGEKLQQQMKSLQKRD